MVRAVRTRGQESDRYLNDRKSSAASSQSHKWFKGLLYLETQNVFADVGRCDEPAAGAPVDAVQSHVGPRAGRAGQRLIIRLVRIDRDDFEQILETAVEIGHQGASEFAARPLLARLKCLHRADGHAKRMGQLLSSQPPRPPHPPQPDPHPP